MSQRQLLFMSLLLFAFGITLALIPVSIPLRVFGFVLTHVSVFFVTYYGLTDIQI